MFAVLALAGDLGCSFGPGLIGLVSNAVEQGTLILPKGLISSSSMTEVGLKAGIFDGCNLSRHIVCRPFAAEHHQKTW